MLQQVSKAADRRERREVLRYQGDSKSETKAPTERMEGLVAQNRGFGESAVFMLLV